MILSLDLPVLREGPGCVLLLLNNLHNDRLKAWFSSQAPNLERSDSGATLEYKFWGGELAVFHTKWHLASEYEKAAIKFASNKLLSVEDNSLRLEYLIEDRYWTDWTTKLGYSEPDNRKSNNESY